MINNHSNLSGVMKNSFLKAPNLGKTLTGAQYCPNPKDKLNLTIKNLKSIKCDMCIVWERKSYSRTYNRKCLLILPNHKIPRFEGKMDLKRFFSGILICKLIQADKNHLTIFCN